VRINILQCIAIWTQMISTTNLHIHVWK
jgi:hypothetical protein